MRFSLFQTQVLNLAFPDLLLVLVSLFIVLLFIYLLNLVRTGGSFSAFGLTLSGKKQEPSNPSQTLTQSPTINNTNMVQLDNSPQYAEQWFELYEKITKRADEIQKSYHNAVPEVLYQTPELSEDILAVYTLRHIVFLNLLKVCDVYNEDLQFWDIENNDFRAFMQAIWPVKNLTDEIYKSISGFDYFANCLLIRNKVSTNEMIRLYYLAAEANLRMEELISKSITDNTALEETG